MAKQKVGVILNNSMNATLNSKRLYFLLIFKCLLFNNTTAFAKPSYF